MGRSSSSSSKNLNTGACGAEARDHALPRSCAAPSPSGRSAGDRRGSYGQVVHRPDDDHDVRRRRGPSRRRPVVTTAVGVAQARRMTQLRLRGDRRGRGADVASFRRGAIRAAEVRLVIAAQSVAFTSSGCSPPPDHHGRGAPEGADAISLGRGTSLGGSSAPRTRTARRTAADRWPPPGRAAR
jgi:hypothetical protein